MRNGALIQYYIIITVNRANELSKTSKKPQKSKFWQSFCFYLLRSFIQIMFNFMFLIVICEFCYNLQEMM